MENKCNCGGSCQCKEEKQTPFMKRVADLEKEVKGLKSQLDVILKVLKNRG